MFPPGKNQKPSFSSCLAEPSNGQPSGLTVGEVSIGTDFVERGEQLGDAVLVGLVPIAHLDFVLLVVDLLFDNEIMIINTEGIIIRMKVSDISILGRVTSGVKLINMEDDVKVASITKVKEDETLEGEEVAEDAKGIEAETATEAAGDEQE